ncbi:PDZ domain-containing protein, partial [Sandarakinorhabdus rubra]|uniref:PDZ domain-containing protein n=1 Tax=Sandarakinorhabdus rubra TaxID=2672568 RepID=UPI001969C007
QAVLAGPAGELVLAFPDARPAATRPQPPGGDPTPWRLALQPVRGADGAISGWRLDSLSGLPQLARAGLRVGDVLLARDGNPLYSEEQIIELPQVLATGGRMQLSLRRGGKTLDVTVSS